MRYCILFFMGFFICLVSFAQTLSIKGRVVDADTDELLIGAHIEIKQGQKNWVTTTERNGFFHLYNLIEGNSVVKISYMGYLTRTTDLNIDMNMPEQIYSLKPSSFSFNEIVITGTGTEHYLKDAPVQIEVISGKALNYLITEIC